MIRSGRSFINVVTACATSSWDTQRLRWTSVRRPTRKPARVGGRSRIGTSTRAMANRWRSYMKPYAPVPVRAPTPVATTPFMTARRLIGIDCYSKSTVTMPNVYDEFVWRGLVYDATDGVADLLQRERLTAYAGFDPTAPSLHVGHMIPAMALARLQRFGHSPIAVVGGGTGMIGDPSGKSQERNLLSLDQIDENVQGVRRQLELFLDFEGGANAARLVNNADWLAASDLLGFLRDTG